MNDINCCIVKDRVYIHWLMPGNQLHLLPCFFGSISSSEAVSSLMAMSRTEIRQWPITIVGNTSPPVFMTVLYDSCASTSSANWILATPKQQLFYSFHEACDWALALCDAHTPESWIIFVLGWDFFQSLGRIRCCRIESRQDSGGSSSGPKTYMDVKLLHRSRPNRIQHQSIAVGIKMLWVLSKVERILV